MKSNALELIHDLGRQISRLKTKEEQLTDQIDKFRHGDMLSKIYVDFCNKELEATKQCRIAVADRYSFVKALYNELIKDSKN